jgi:RNA polymerase sigma-70 factor (ECF subfamily)
VDDRELHRRLSAGDEAAYEWLYRRWYAPLVRLAEAKVKVRAIAEEVVQDVMLELWRRRANLDPDGSISAYLYQATRNRVFSHLRHDIVHRRSEPHLQRENTVAHADAELAHQEIDTALQAAVSELPERCREVFVMSRLHGLKYGEIAQAVGVSVKTVEADMGKALRHLRVRMAPWLPSVRPPGSAPR